MREFTLCLLALAACTSETPPARAPAAAAPVEEASSTREGPACDDALVLRDLEDGGLAVAPDPGFGVARVAWRDDLNGDGLVDLALRFPDACGNWGDCPYAVLAACDGERYTVVWGPEYCVKVERVEVEKGDGGGEGWTELVAVDRLGDDAARRVWRFADGRYRRASP